MGERLSFSRVKVTGVQEDAGVTAYEATAAGVTYRVVSGFVSRSTNRRGRTYRAFRVVPDAGAGSSVLVQCGGGRQTYAGAIQQCQDDLGDVLRDRRVEANFETVQERDERVAGCAEQDPATADDTQELMDRVVRRAQYLALQGVLAELDKQHAATGMTGPVWSRDSIGRMVNDAARALGTAQPYRVAP